MSPNSLRVIAEGDARAEDTRQKAYRAAGGDLTRTEWNYARMICEARIRAAKSAYLNPTGELILPDQFDLELWKAVRLYNG